MRNNNGKAATLDYADIDEGNVYTFEKFISQEDVNSFAALTGDYNPLHVNKEFGEKSRFNNTIVHGMLAGSLFSTLVGIYCPGEKCLYVSQTLKFKKPVFPGDNVTVKGTVVSKNDSVKIVTIKTELFVNNLLAITGEAKVGVIDG